MGLNLAWRSGPVHPLPHAKFHPHRCKDKGIGPPKLNILWKFYQILEYKCPAGAFSLHDFHKICRISTSLQDALTFKIWMDLLRGYGAMGV